MLSHRGKFKRTRRGEPGSARCGKGACAEPRGERADPGRAVPEPDAPSLGSLSLPEDARSGERIQAASLSFPRAREAGGGGAAPARPGEAGTHLRSEVEEQGDAADDLAQPQPQEGHEHGARGGGGLGGRGRRGRRRGQGTLVRGAPAAHLLGAAQVLAVVAAGAAHGARPAGSAARLRPSLRPLLVCPPPTPKAGAARGQAGLDVGRSERAGLPGAGERAGRPAAPTLINLFERAGLRSQSARGEAASSTPTSGSPSFLSPSLSFLLSRSTVSSPSGPSEEEAVGCSSGSRRRWAILSCLCGGQRDGLGELQMSALVKEKGDLTYIPRAGSSHPWASVSLIGFRKLDLVISEGPSYLPLPPYTLPSKKFSILRDPEGAASITVPILGSELSIWAVLENSRTAFPNPWFYTLKVALSEAGFECGSGGPIGTTSGFLKKRYREKGRTQQLHIKDRILHSYRVRHRTFLLLGGFPSVPQTWEGCTPRCRRPRRPHPTVNQVRGMLNEVEV